MSAVHFCSFLSLLTVFIIEVFISNSENLFAESQASVSLIFLIYIGSRIFFFEANFSSNLSFVILNFIRISLPMESDPRSDCLNYFLRLGGFSCFQQKEFAQPLAGN